MADIKNTGNPGGQTGTPNRTNPPLSGGQTGTNQGDRGFVDTAKDKVQTVVDRVSDYAGQAREKAEEVAGDAYGAAKDAGHRVQRWAGDTYDEATDRIGDFGTEVSGLIRRHPIPALLIGFGVGLLLGRAARMV